MPPRRESGDFAINHPPILVVVTSSIADRRVRSGCEQLEKKEVVWWTKNGGMSEHPPFSSIVVCGHVGAVGGVGGSESQRRDRKAIRGVNTDIRYEGGA